eukprot:CAMPEP_0184697058 /NCGR_PEP_ID=MMETSP0313-20130426/4161_1 /TAXON_ID=2792 /ORGANISM="Porphyridium aerugineum, Strain SAG 1380-2" /LENGTH=367 /DNA_ID=CAMNT_0027155819 /DNA_START=68 /DNA_END=1167 /DNA_ORIENTATION=-
MNSFAFVPCGLGHSWYGTNTAFNYVNHAQAPGRNSYRLHTQHSKFYGCQHVMPLSWHPNSLSPASSSSQRLHMKYGDYTAVMIVPTGINAAIGGFAGDALPSARLLASVADTLITHPNVLNGAMMYWPIPNALYVEGLALDLFAAGDVSLQRVASNRIGVVLDCGMEDDMMLRHIQVLDAARATLGLQVVAYQVTDAPLDVHLEMGQNHSSWGTLSRPDSLLRAAHELVEKQRCDAIAVVARFPDDEEDDDALQLYRQGEGVDEIGGAEAVISHLVVRELGVPCAHAPGLPPLDVDDSVSPKNAAEELGYTFLPCVLVGLSRAPRLIPASMLQGNSSVRSDVVDRGDVDAVILPVMACGGSAFLSLA